MENSDNITTYTLKSHQKYPHLDFAVLEGDHESDFAMHKHDFAEMFIVYEGEGDHTVASNHYSLRKGDVFVIHGDVEHSFRNVNNLKLVNLMFATQSPFFESEALRCLPGYHALFQVEPKARLAMGYTAKLNLNSQQLGMVTNLIRQISAEYSTAPSGFELMLTSLMQQLLITLSRIYQDPQLQVANSTLALSRALVYIDQHYADTTLCSEAIANEACVSKRQLERLFRQYMQTSPNQYLRNLQLEHAQILLQSKENHSLIKISQYCGFADSNYFSKCFKQKFGMSPREFRTQYFRN